MIIAPLAAWCLGHPDDVIKAGMGVKRWVKRHIQDKSFERYEHAIYAEEDPADANIIVIFVTPESYELIDN